MDLSHGGYPSEEDISIELFVIGLKKEADWIYSRLEDIRQDVWNDETSHDSDIAKEYYALNGRLDFILSQIGAPDEEALWTSDEVSAALTEENLQIANARWQRALKQRNYLGALVNSSLATEGTIKEHKLWTSVVQERLVEIYRLENLLFDNPASDWLPY